MASQPDVPERRLPRLEQNRNMLAEKHASTRQKPCPAWGNALLKNAVVMVCVRDGGARFRDKPRVRLRPLMGENQ
jgi:hypothetical protein